MAPVILGAGMTGLAAGLASGFDVLEAEESPGGICSSYYVRPRERERLSRPPPDREAYRFEIGGGHWIFGGDPVALAFVERLAPVRHYERRSSVYFRATDTYVPYPLQYHLRWLGPTVAARAIAEISQPQGPTQTMKEWLLANFGATLCDLFLFPFHELYTSGLYGMIAPQDHYKTPLTLATPTQGGLHDTTAVGYNVSFIYPEEGLNHLAQEMARRGRIRCGRRVVRADPHARELSLADGSRLRYGSLVTTLPLNRMMEMTGLTTQAKPDPYTSVLVLNVGAVRGPRCPDDHWIYNSDAKSGFHRIGIYSNVDRSFLPATDPPGQRRVGLYIERAFRGGQKPGETEVSAYSDSVVRELQDWGFIEDVEVTDPTWIETAYTWSWPGSTWRREALGLLQDHGIHPVGRYARWVFQGIADSIRDGLFAGAALRGIAT